MSFDGATKGRNCSEPRVVVIVQARLGSSRLPGKILLEAGGIPLLELLLTRLLRCNRVDEIVLATTNNPLDNVLAKFAREGCISLFRGSEDDVLDRYYNAAVGTGADIVVRITADCPLHDPKVVDAAIERFISSGADYLSNRNPPTFPDGFDLEIFTVDALTQAWRAAARDYEREHVTPFITDRAQTFKIAHFSLPMNYSDWRLTLDYEEDYILLRHIVESLLPENSNFDLHDVLTFLDGHPELKDVNRNYSRDAAYHEQRRRELEADREGSSGTATRSEREK